ncbi:MAG: (d)CMP kinase [Fretibacterium sp.]|nr:(d)CMP kinase [Fretibacterium sp.]
MLLAYVITIDGPAGAGKSSVAKRLAQLLGIHYLDTGAIYRAIALVLAEAGIRPEESESLKKALPDIKIELRGETVLANGDDVSREIRTPKADRLSSVYSALPSVRQALLGLQRDQEKYGSLVVEGRDEGSVVFPKAPLKFFLTATPEARARRRCLERERRGEPVDYGEVLASIRERDTADSSRDVSPLVQPEGAVRVDTSDMTEDEVVELLLNHVREALSRGEITE